MDTKKFEPGQVVVTRGVDKLMKADEDFDIFVKTSLGRHANGDWGDLVRDDREMNDRALKTGEDRLFSSYTFKDKGFLETVAKWSKDGCTETDISKRMGMTVKNLRAHIAALKHGKIWIITEWDRSKTTVLFPHEY